MPRVTISVPDKTAQPYRFQLDREEVTLGRGSENDIVIESGSVSVSHAVMRRIPGGYELADTGSTNGIKLGEERLAVIPLRNGMTAGIGDAFFDFELSPDEEAALATEQAAKPVTTGGVPFTSFTSDDIPEHKSEREPAYTHSRGGSGFGAFLLFLILAAVAFCAGLAIRHQKDTGGSLLDAVKAHRAEKPATGAPPN